MRKTLLLLALLACAGPLAAQTIVSGTVADSSSNAYSYAVMSITNSTGKVRPDFNLTAGGAFSLQLPSGTYTFTASFAGVAPPVGTGPQTCTASNVAVSGSTQTITFSGCAGLIQLSGSGGGMVWPVGGAGVPNYSGTNSWGTSYSASNTLPENFLPAATVFTDQNATFGAHTYDFSGMTLGKWRLSAGLTTTANGDFGYDSTNSNWHFWNGADSIVAPLASGFVSGHCGQPTSSAGKWVIADTGAACGTSAFTNLGTTTTVLHGNAAGTPSFAVVTPSDASGNTSGSGNFCLVTNCVMTTPNLGTPSALVLTNATGLPAAQVLSGALANGMTATTQTGGSNDTKVATDAYVDTHFIANGTATLGTGAISSAACATAVTVAATGVATTDVINFTPNADISGVTGYAPSTGGTLFIYAYPTANNVNFKVCNNTSASITPGAVTLNWKVTR